jgi:hypothetical protein
MALLDIFTGDPYKRAAENYTNYLASERARLAGVMGGAGRESLASLESGRLGALGAVGGGFETARGDISGYTPQALGALYGGAAEGQGYLAGAEPRGLAALESGVERAIGGYAPVSNLANRYAGYGTTASEAQRDALGLNGPEGIARSRQAFQATPGYEFARNQAIEGAVRGANVAGMATVHVRPYRTAAVIFAVSPFWPWYGR